MGRRHRQPGCTVAPRDASRRMAAPGGLRQQHCLAPASAASTRLEGERRGPAAPSSSGHVLGGQSKQGLVIAEAAVTDMRDAMHAWKEYSASPCAWRAAEARPCQALPA